MLLPQQYHWIFLLAGFLGFYTLFLRTSPFVKILAIGGFVNCFFSTAPFLSFASYMVLVSGCYLFILLTKIKNWSVIFNLLFALMVLNCFLMVMQVVGGDSLLNFGLGKDIVCYGMIPNKMQFQSFLIILSALLIQKLRGRTLALVILSGILYTILYGGLHNHVLGSFLARATCWRNTIRLSLHHPLSGWGLDTYKYLFPILGRSGIPGEFFTTAHNDWLQVLFETGFPGLIFMASVFVRFVYKAVQARNWRMFAGLVLICYDLSVHFPMREVQCAVLLVVFFAYLNRRDVA